MNDRTGADHDHHCPPVEEQRVSAVRKKGGGCRLLSDVLTVMCFQLPTIKFNGKKQIETNVGVGYGAGGGWPGGAIDRWR